MVENIPEKKDFGEVANHLLHRAWSSTIDIISHFPEYYVVNNLNSENQKQPTSPDLDLNLPKGSVDAYWSGVRSSLAANVASITQAVEFFLKGRICEVSPYLLLSTDGKGWTGKNVDFTNFKTVDSQYLFKIHDSVCQQDKKLGEIFSSWYSDIRKERNKIMHTVDVKASYEPYSILCRVLECHKFFYGPRKWCKARRLFLQTDAMTSLVFIKDNAEKEGHISQKIYDELELLFDFIEPAKSLDFFNFNKKGRAAHCPYCLIPAIEHFHSEPDNYLATLQQAEGSDYLTCFVCGHKAVYSGACIDDDCDGKTLEFATKKCLWCESLK